MGALVASRHNPILSAFYQRLIADGKEGLLVPPRDPGALASAALRILGDEGLARRLAEAARRAALERHSSAAVAAKVDGLYRRILGRRM